MTTEQQFRVEDLPGEQTEQPSNGYHRTRFVPRVGIGEAARRHWLLVLIPVLALVGAAGAIGVLRHPTYTAESKLNVGQINASQPGALSGYVTATQGLAQTYARAITADQVTVPVAKKLHTSPDAISSHISASSIPQTPVMTIDGQSTDAGKAVAIANAASGALVSYVNHTNTPNANTILSQYEQAARDYSRALAETKSAQDAYNKSHSSTDRAALDNAVGREQSVKVRRDALQTQYQNATQFGTNANVSVLNPASSASSDRYSRLEILLFIGLVAGLAVGLALAVLKANRTLRRGIAL